MKIVEKNKPDVKTFAHLALGSVFRLPECDTIFMTIACDDFNYVNLESGFCGNSNGDDEVILLEVELHVL